ncbi:electron transport complex subunit RsxC [Aliidiomarina iranensis]|uniref:Ion-translocating oxidoreductase complex subunit C n=1 Tax=Aliidiomarina iranensis TaxID=1434071 RepID=A0A432VSK0_9GAMM|nr:electron transport complex subunit RsxC [Aliidiomarina iranensis]RUO19306.1 electron transport complex subunit RsxC [Aliidiomarina iranensis]
MAVEISATSKLWRFPGGIHPPERKAPANLNNIQRFPLPPMLFIPLHQHIGEDGELCVAVGDYVLKGQPLTIPGVNNGLPVHATTSGTITAIHEHPLNHPSGLTGLTVCLEPDGKEAWYPRQPLNNMDALSQREVLQHLQAMGIAGLGGAGFPTARKVAGAKNIDVLIINGVECEPYIASDDRLMREHAKEILAGSHILQKLTFAKQLVIAIEDNKPEAAAAFREAIEQFSVTADFSADGADPAGSAARTNRQPILKIVPTRYPSGGEKQLIQVLTGKQVPVRGLPADIGILMQNVATAYAVERAVNHGEPLLERVVTITGEAVKNPGTAWALLGTPIDYLLAQSGFKPGKKQRVIMGGPMMGFTVTNLQIPVIKTTNCVLAPTHKELTPPQAEMACIRCGACEIACPASLLPQQLQWLAKAQDYAGLKQHHLADCIECGACAYVCPSQIPLVQYYRQAKAEIREQTIEQQKSEIARQRFEARQARLEREKEERLEKHRKAAEARKAAQAARQSEATATEQDPVKAALARVKAKKAQQTAPAANTESPQGPAGSASQTTPEHKVDQKTDQKDAVAAAVARAKAKKAERDRLAQAENNNEAEKPIAAKNAPDHDKKDAVAAAVARAKAKKAERERLAQAENNASTTNTKGSDNG